MPAETAFSGDVDLDRALELALKNNKQLKVSQEGVRAAEGRVAEARAAFLPSVDLSFAYTPAQQFPLIRIPAGIFGPDEQTFQAAFTRQNIMSLQLNQPLYTGDACATRTPSRRPAPRRAASRWIGRARS